MEKIFKYTLKMPVNSFNLSNVVNQNMKFYASFLNEFLFPYFMGTYVSRKTLFSLFSFFIVDKTFA